VSSKRSARAKTSKALLVETYGTEGDVLRHVTVWESQAHKDRYEAPQQLLVFDSLGMASDVGGQHSVRHLRCSWLLRPSGLTVVRTTFWDGRRHRPSRNDDPNDLRIGRSDRRKPTDVLSMIRHPRSGRSAVAASVANRVV